MKKDIMECIKFLERNKFKMFCFLKEKSPFFPSCCVDSTLVLTKFLRDYYCVEVQIKEGKKKMFPNRKKFHLWMEIGDFVIDGTKFQFYIGNNKFKSLSSLDAYEYCIEDVQMDTICFSLNAYEKQFGDIVSADVEWYLKQYQKDIWDFKINVEIDADDAFSEYLDYVGNWLF